MKQLGGQILSLNRAGGGKRGCDLGLRGQPMSHRPPKELGEMRGGSPRRGRKVLGCCWEAEIVKLGPVLLSEHSFILL